MAKLTKETLLEWYQQMVLIREFEETCQQLYNEKRITGVYLHLYSGHEAIGVGSIATMKKGVDHVITAYRDHGIALLVGMDEGPVMAEMMGRRAGSSGGKGGSMHLAAPDKHFWGGYAIVGGHVPLGVGVALEAQYNKTGAAVICYVGDGATNNGYFHEAANMAGLWHLPIVFIIENNGYGMGTETERSSGNPMLHVRAEGYGIKDFGRIDGQNVFEVYDEVGKAMQHAREHGPVLMEAITYRYRGHGVSDKQYNTRMAEELAEWKAKKDPIIILRNGILERFKSVSAADLDQYHAQAKATVAKAVEFAEASPLPDTLEELYANVYVE